jgi:hypothetical protein
LILPFEGLTKIDLFSQLSLLVDELSLDSIAFCDTISPGSFSDN